MGASVTLVVPSEANPGVDARVGPNSPLATSASGARSVFRIASSAASTNASSVKATTGRVFTVTGFNGNAAARYLKLYNKASAPVVGTDAPFLTEYLPAQSKFEITFGGLVLSAGIALALTTGVADDDTGAVGAGDILAFNMGYT